MYTWTMFIVGGASIGVVVANRVRVFVPNMEARHKAFRHAQNAHDNNRVQEKSAQMPTAVRDFWLASPLAKSNKSSSCRGRNTCHVRVGKYVQISSENARRQQINLPRRLHLSYVPSLESAQGSFERGPSMPCALWYSR